MKVRRANDDLMISGEITSVTIKENGNAVLEVRTVAKATLYKLVLTPSDVETMKMLFWRGGNG